MRNALPTSSRRQKRTVVSKPLVLLILANSSPFLEALAYLVRRTKWCAPRLKGASPSSARRFLVRNVHSRTERVKLAPHWKNIWYSRKRMSVNKKALTRATILQVWTHSYTKCPQTMLPLSSEPVGGFWFTGTNARAVGFDGVRPEMIA